MPAFSLLKLSDKLACQSSPVTYGVLRPGDLVSAADVLAVEDQESLTFRYARLDKTHAVRRITAEMRAGRVITVVWSDGSFDEWRVGVVTMGRGEGGIISVSCVPLWLDLVERADSSSGKGWVSDLGMAGRNFDYEITERDATGILTDYVIPACPSWVGLGDVDPTYTIKTLSVSRLTPGGLTLAVRDSLRAVDVSCEVRLRRNGTTNYLLDLVTEIGSSGNTPVFHPSVSLLTLQMRSDPTLQATRVLVKGATTPDGLPGIWGRARWRCGAPSGNVIALTDRNGGSSPIAFDDQFVGMYLLRVKTGRTFPITDSDATLGTVTLGGGVSTIAADEDVEFRVDEPLTNTRTTSTRYAVSAVPDGTHITCGASAPITTTNQYADWYAKVWSAGVGGTVIATTRISASVAATDVLTVASSAGVNNTHYVEFVQLDGAGEVPCFVDHPTYAQADPTGYGIKAMELSRQAQGAVVLNSNAWMRAYSNPASPPDGWTVNGTITYSRDAVTTRYGGYSWHWTAFAGAIITDALITPPTYFTGDNDRCSVRMWVNFSTYTSGADTGYSVLRVFALTASGGIGATLGECPIAPLDSTAPNSVTLVDSGAWVELKVEGIPITATTAPYGVSAAFYLQAGGSFSGTVQGYVDVIEIYPFATCPSDDFEFGDATSLLQAACNQLRTVASPPLFYSFLVRDLERTHPTEYSRNKITLGANVRAADAEYGIDATVRLLKMERDLLNPSDTRLTLANRPTLLTTILGKSARTSSRIISSVNAGSNATSNNGAAFVQLVGPALLVAGAEISTGSTLPPLVTLPTVTVNPSTGEESVGTSVTYVPPDPTTTPQTVVTVGTPRSRQKPPYLIPER